jgi:hypothetical protein
MAYLVYVDECYSLRTCLWHFTLLFVTYTLFFGKIFIFLSDVKAITCLYIHDIKKKLQKMCVVMNECEKMSGGLESQPL